MPTYVSSGQPQAGTPRPTRRRPPGLVLSLSGAAVAVLGLLLVWGLALRGGGDSATTASGVGTPSATPASQPSAAPASSAAPTTAPGPTFSPTLSPTLIPTPPPDPVAVAQQNLQQQRDADLASITLRGQWVAQLASKHDGVPDPLQTASDGSHVFHNPDILTEFQRLKAGSSGARVFLLLSTDYGSRRLSADGHVLWVTFADGDFSSQDDVLAWCHRRFPTLAGKVFLDQCQARVLNPPS